MTSVASQGALVGRGSSDTERIAIYGTGRPSLKPSEPPNAGKYGFNFKFVGGLWRLVRFATKWDLLVVGFLLGLIIANLYVGSQSGNVTGQFYNVIVDKNEQQFKKVLWQATIVIILSALLESAIKLVLDLIAFRWRKLLVQKLHHRYFSRSMFYQILHLDHTIDNPDQRITQDVDLLTQASQKVLRVVFEAPLTIGFYGYLTVSSITWYSPLLVVGYWLIAYLINKVVMNPSVTYVFRQEQLEGNFRFGHLRVRTNAESIALYGGGSREATIANATLQSLLKNRLRLISWETCITTTSNIFAYFASVVNYAIVSLPIFKGWTLPPSAGGAAKYVSIASFRLLMLVNGFTQFNNLSRDSADFIGYCNRVSQLFEIVDQLERSEVAKHFNVNKNKQLDPPSSSSEEDPLLAPKLTESSDANEDFVIPPAILNHTIINATGITISSLPPMPEQAEAIVFEHFSSYTPSGQPLVRNLELTIPAGCSLFISGPSGSGKTSLIRCLSGLWRSFDGCIRRPSSILFLPQRPYLPFGTLQDQLMYPLVSSHALLHGPIEDAVQESLLPASSQRLWNILKDVELEYLITRPNALNSSALAHNAHQRASSSFDPEDGFKDEATSLLAGTDSLPENTAEILEQIESANLNWTEVLSPGEQQRIGLARVLYHNPRFVVLDEATSSVDEPLEEKFYQICKDRQITVITIAHKSSMKKFHQLQLHLDRQGNWKVSEI